MNNGVVSIFEQVFKTNATLAKIVIVSLFKAVFSIADFFGNFVFYICLTIIYVDSDTSMIEYLLLKMVEGIRPETVAKVQAILETPINIAFHHNVSGVIA